uniref:Uncharacterized protein n=1 Tax=Rhizophagus irregularis (strain DAOM 181602 / DAOM 197198 / MUCL 43194) TaxID=747089 RepID=U9UN00_RHIID
MINNLYVVHHSSLSSSKRVEMWQDLPENQGIDDAVDASIETNHHYGLIFWIFIIE